MLHYDQSMINFFRKIRQKMLTENKFSRYLLYAIGEIVLVVIGILIALQINNWNQNKIDNKALKGYLTSISNNIKEDIEKIESIKQKRANAMTRVPYLIGRIGNLDYLEKAHIKFSSETMNTLSKIEYLITDESGFESMKNSVYLSKLQGKDLENLIYKYYNLVQETAKKENDYNEDLKTSLNNFHEDLHENMYYLNYPDYIADKEQLTMLQPFLKKIIFHRSAMRLYLQTAGNGPSLIVNYDNLKVLGNEIVRMIANDLKTFDETSIKNMENTFNLNSETGYATVLKNGAFFNAFYEMGHGGANNVLIKVVQGIDEISFFIPKLEWAVVYLRNPSNVQAEKPTKDFSSYNSIKLELKGETEGDTVFIAIKDATDLDDGSETQIPIRLSSEWKTYEVELSEFKTANLKELFVVVNFIFYDKAQNISVRNIEYVK